MGIAFERFETVENTTTKISGTLYQEDESTVLGSGTITTLTLTLTNEADGATINTRSAQNVLNTNNVTLDANGLLVWDVQKEDVAIQGSSIAIGATEVHIALFQWTYSSGAKDGAQMVFLDVKNLGIG